MFSFVPADIVPFSFADKRAGRSNVRSLTGRLVSTLNVLVAVQINLYPGTIYIEYPQYIEKISPLISLYLCQL